MDASQFPPVQWLNDRQPWDSPQYIPGAPHNLPARPDPAVAGSTQHDAFVGDSVAIRDSYRYASLVDLSQIIGIVSIKIVDQPIGKRNLLGFRNASTAAQNLYIGFGGAATTNSWLALAAGALILFDTVVPQDDIYAVSDAAGAVLSYVYSTFPG